MMRETEREREIVCEEREREREREIGRDRMSIIFGQRILMNFFS